MKVLLWSQPVLSSVTVFLIAKLTWGHSELLEVVSKLVTFTLWRLLYAAVKGLRNVQP